MIGGNIGLIVGAVLAFLLNWWLGFDPDNYRHQIFAALSTVAMMMVAWFIGWSISDWRKDEDLF